jgi:hypothetical protein
VRSYGRLEQAPGLVNPDHADDVGSPRAAKAIGAIHARREGGAGEARRVPQIGLVVGDLILQGDRTGDALTEVRRIGELVHAGIVGVAADEPVTDVAGITGPGRVELGYGLADCGNRRTG